MMQTENANQKLAEEIMLQIKPVGITEYTNVRDFYYSLIDEMEQSEFKPGWERDIYPTQEFLIQSIESNELFIGMINEQIAACMVVNHNYNEGYNNIRWSITAADAELYVIHALGVHPNFSGRGIAKQMVRSVIEMAKKNHMKTIRLDVLGGNLPAERAYTKMNFQYVDTIKMFYEDTGWTDFKLFEYLV